jgi:hypothetical protein
MEAKSFSLFEQQELIRKMVDNDENPTFFILNNSDRPDRNGKPTKGQGMILFSVMTGGQSRVVRVPVSWVPIDATQQAPKKAIVESAEFQRALSSGAIIVMSHDQGRKVIVGDNDSKAEYERIMAIAQGVNGAGDYQGVNGDQNEPAEDMWANVTPEVKLNVEEMQNGTMQETEFRSFLRRSARSISALDRKYISDKLPEFNFSSTGVVA